MTKKKIEVCMICITEEIIYDNKFKIEQIKNHLDIIKCTKCKNKYHKVCLGNNFKKDNFICCEKNKKCNYCKESKGYLYIFDKNHYAHKLCLFLKDYFITDIKNIKFEKNIEFFVNNKKLLSKPVKKKKNSFYYLCECCCSWFDYNDLNEFIEEGVDLNFEENEDFICLFCYYFLYYFYIDQLPTNIKKYKNLENLDLDKFIGFFKTIHIHIFTFYIENNYKEINYNNCKPFILLFFKTLNEDNQYVTGYQLVDNIIKNNFLNITFIKNKYTKITDDKVQNNYEKLNEFFEFVLELFKKDFIYIYEYIHNKVYNNELNIDILKNKTIHELIKLNNLIKAFILNPDFHNYLDIKKYNELFTINKIKNNINFIEKEFFFLFHEINNLLEIKNNNFRNKSNFYNKFSYIFNDKSHIFWNFVDTIFNDNVVDIIKERFYLSKENWVKYINSKIQEFFNLDDKFYLINNIENDIIFLEDIKINFKENKYKIKKIYQDSWKFNTKKSELNINTFIEKKSLLSNKFIKDIKNLREFENIKDILNIDKNNKTYDFNYIYPLLSNYKNNKEILKLYNKMHEIKVTIDKSKNFLDPQEQRSWFDYNNFLLNYNIKYKEFEEINNKYNFFIELESILFNNYSLEDYKEVNEKMLNIIENKIYKDQIACHHIYNLFNLKIKNFRFIESIKKFKTLIIQNYFLELRTRLSHGKYNYEIINLFIKSDINFTNSKFIWMKKILKENEDIITIITNNSNQISEIMDKNLICESFEFIENILDIRELLNNIFNKLEISKKNILNFYNFSKYYTDYFKEKDFISFYNFYIIIDVLISMYQDNSFLFENFKLVNTLLNSINNINLDNYYIKDLNNKNLFINIVSYWNKMIHKNCFFISKYHNKKLKFNLKIYLNTNFLDFLYQNEINKIKETCSILEKKKEYFKIFDCLLKINKFYNKESLLSFYQQFLKLKVLKSTDLKKSNFMISFENYIDKLYIIIKLVFLHDFNSNSNDFNISSNNIFFLSKSINEISFVLKNWNLYLKLNNSKCGLEDNIYKYNDIEINKIHSLNELNLMILNFKNETLFLREYNIDLFQKLSPEENDNFRFFLIIMHQIFDNPTEYHTIKIWFCLVIIYYIDICKNIVFNDKFLKLMFTNLFYIYEKKDWFKYQIKFIIKFYFHYEKYIMKNDYFSDNFFHFINLISNNYNNKFKIQKRQVKELLEENFGTMYNEILNIDDDIDFKENFCFYLKKLDN